jgi:hypothetical protein
MYFSITFEEICSFLLSVIWLRRFLSKAWICGRSHAGIAGSNPAAVTDIYCECYMYISIEQQ